MIKTTQHFLKELNTGKHEMLGEFISEYRRVGELIIDQIWTNGYKWITDNTEHEFNISKNLLKAPSFIDYNDFNIETTLTARAICSLTNQICGMLGSATEKQRKRLYMLDEKKKEGASKKQRKLLAKKIKTNIPQKPNCEFMNAELSSKCIDWQETTFGGVLRLKSIFKDKREIKIPLKFHNRDSVMKENRYIMKNSFLITTKKIDIRWEKESPKLKAEGLVVGGDQGILTVLTLSDKQVTPNTDNHNHSLESIMHKLEQRKKGSKAFKRCRTQRNQFINWSINQLDLTNIKEIRLEQIWNIGYKNPRSRYMSHWTHKLIADKVASKCEQHGVHVVENPSTYKSQRCSCCGNVRKANRKGKIYTCKNCGLIIDADLNSSINHSMDLPEVPYTLRQRNLNRSLGFLWTAEGFFTLAGTSLESVPHVEPKVLTSIALCQ